MEHIKEYSRLRVAFVMCMKIEHYDKYIQLPLERRDYLFLLWVKKHHPENIETVEAAQA